MSKLQIFKNSFDVPFINSDGNIEDSNFVDRFYIGYLDDKKIVRLTKDYYFIDEFDDNRFIVADAISNQPSLEYASDIDDSFLRFRYGVIELDKGIYNEYIPYNENVIVPFAYSMIYRNNEDTLTVKNEKGLFSYVDMDKSSENYGKQLVPCVLSIAGRFDEEYAFFAECCVDGKYGYISRAMKPRDSFSEDDLLSEEQVRYISFVLKNKWDGLSIENSEPKTLKLVNKYK